MKITNGELFSIKPIKVLVIDDKCFGVIRETSTTLICSPVYSRDLEVVEDNDCWKKTRVVPTSDWSGSLLKIRQEMVEEYKKELAYVKVFNKSSVTVSDFYIETHYKWN